MIEPTKSIEPIHLTTRQIGEGTVQTVNARDLHAFLGVRRDFSNWVKDRIEKYEFVKNRDFVIAQESRSPNLASEKINDLGAFSLGENRTDYHITIDMAKELSMVERTEKGKQARRYFIECERRAKSGATDINVALSDPAKLRGLLLVYTEKVIALEAKVQEQEAKVQEQEAKVREQAPKAKFHDAVAGAINCQSVQEIAKVLGTGPNRLFEFLREERLLMANNLPYQRHLDAGYFRVVERQYHDKHGESNTYTRTLVTGKGLAYIQRRIQSPNGLFRAA